jgi:hypothetical protein
MAAQSVFYHVLDTNLVETGQARSLLVKLVIYMNRHVGHLTSPQPKRLIVHPINSAGRRETCHFRPRALASHSLSRSSRGRVGWGRGIGGVGYVWPR